MIRFIHKTNPFSYIPVVLCGAMLLSALLMSSTAVSADDDTSVVDQINITVPIACTISGTGQNSHNATINNGQYDSAVGETIIKALCNDNEGFAIYAVGFTDDEYGKNVLSSSTLDSTFDITTGTTPSGANSNWAMKLSTITNPEPTYPIVIENNYDSFQEVPDEYTMVAKRESGTDIGTGAEGSALRSTYQVYISSTQPSGTYTGQVKYTLIHPNDANPPVSSNQIGVIFNGNGLSFANGSSTNRVVYRGDYVARYISTEPTIVSSSNILSDGTKNGPYSDEEDILEVLSFDGAESIVVEVRYGITANTSEIILTEGEWDVTSFSEPSYVIYSETDDLSGEETLTFNDNTMTILMQSWSLPSGDYDYGLYAKVYPIYSTRRENTEETTPVFRIASTPEFGEYVETSTWKGYWYLEVNGKTITFANENEIIDYLNANSSSLAGTTITINAGNPTTFDEVYAAANKTKIDNLYAIQDLDGSMCNDVTIGQTTTVRDTRDGTSYTIGKLQDSNCWLLDNLALDLTDSSVQSNMSSHNTNASDTALSYLFGSNTRNPNVDPDGNYATSGVSEVWLMDDYSSDYNYTNPRIAAEQKSYTNANDPLSAESATWKYGIYYNYCAASAGSYCYNKSSFVPSIDIDQDICPSNWKIPSGGTTGNYQVLGNIITGSDEQSIKDGYDTQYRLALHLPLSGSFSAHGEGYTANPLYGYFWSSTVPELGNINDLKATTSEAFPGPGPGVYPSGSNGPERGYSVRCILHATSE